MKKTILSLAAVFAFGFASAQTIVEKEVINESLVSSKGEYYLPQAGDWGLTFGAEGPLTYLGNLFNGNTANNSPSFNLGYDGIAIVGKMFTSNKEAYRAIANIGVGMGSETNVIVPKVETEDLSESNVNLLLGAGKEWRKGNSRLQGYYGADALFIVGKSGNTRETKTMDPTTGKTISTTKTEVSNPFSFGIGVQGFAGVEYFIFPKMSIGAEYMLPIGIHFSGARKTTTTVTTPTSSNSTTVEGGSNFYFGIGERNGGGVGIGSITLSFYF